QVLGIDPDLVIPDRRLSVFDGAVAPWKGEKLDWWRQNFVNVAKIFNFPVHKSIADLTDKQYKQLWEGSDGVMGINDFFKDVQSQ
ncbi:MAG: excinuclease ABC subunit A, partial [Chitinophagaceae bacterium]